MVAVMVKSVCRTERKTTVALPNNLLSGVQLPLTVISATPREHPYLLVRLYHRRFYAVLTDVGTRCRAREGGRRTEPVRFCKRQRTLRPMFVAETRGRYLDP